MQYYAVPKAVAEHLEYKLNPFSLVKFNFDVFSESSTVTSSITDKKARNLVYLLMHVKVAFLI